MSRFQFDPDSYRELMAEEIPDYARLQDEAAAASAGLPSVRRILDLGTGTGETARRVLANQHDAELIGIDTSEAMLAKARTFLPDADLRVGRLEDPLPDGPFDLVVSALAVHHLSGPAKAHLFVRIAALLSPHGRLVLADIVVPDGHGRATRTARSRCAHATRGSRPAARSQAACSAIRLGTS